MKELKITKRTDPPSIEQVLRMPREREPYSPFLIEISKKKNKLSLAAKIIALTLTFVIIPLSFCFGGGIEGGTWIREGEAVSGSGCSRWQIGIALAGHQWLDAETA